jgi:hypothetical protein
LRDQLLAGVLREECLLGQKTEFGQRYSVDLAVQHGDLQARIRSAWIIRQNEKDPRLVSCYVV